MDSLSDIVKKNHHLIGKIATQNSNGSEYLIRDVFIDDDKVMVKIQVGHEAALFPVIEIGAFEKKYTVNSN